VLNFETVAMKPQKVDGSDEGRIFSLFSIFVVGFVTQTLGMIIVFELCGI